MQAHCSTSPPYHPPMLTHQAVVQHPRVLRPQPACLHGQAAHGGTPRLGDVLQLHGSASDAGAVESGGERGEEQSGCHLQVAGEAVCGGRRIDGWNRPAGGISQTQQTKTCTYLPPTSVTVFRQVSPRFPCCPASSYSTCSTAVTMRRSSTCGRPAEPTEGGPL